MRTDQLIDQPATTTGANLPTAPASAKKKPGGKWLNRGDEIFSYLERHEHEKEGWYRSSSAMIALLKHADKMIRQQEQRIRHLESIAITDELTGLKNRRGLVLDFDRELDRINRGQSQGGIIILIDLDNFKPVNDTYGHPAGDAVLKLVAQTLEADIRKMDVAARLGGDEFALLFANTNKTKAAARLQQLIWKLNRLSLVWYGTEISVRASLGVKEFGTGDTIDRIFSAADVKLYDDKRRRKDQDPSVNAMMKEGTIS